MQIKPFEFKVNMGEKTCILVLTDRSLVTNHQLENSDYVTDKRHIPKVSVKTESVQQIWKNKDISDYDANSVPVKTTVPLLTKIPKNLSEFQPRGVFQGYIHTTNIIPKLKDQYEERTASKFILYSQTRNFGDGDWMEGKHRVQWEIAPNREYGVSLPFQGIPFFVVGHTIYDCQHGRDRNIKKKQLRIKSDNLEFSAPKKRRVQHQDSKKIDCPAQILMREVIMFPEFKLAIDSHKRRQCVSRKLRMTIDMHREGKDMLQTERRIYIYFPYVDEHQNHLTGGNLSSKFLEPVDPRITQKIHQLTFQGVTGTKKMRDHINGYVKEIFQDSNPESAPTPLDRRRYNPGDQDIRNAMKKAQAEIRKANRNALQAQCSSLMHCIRQQMTTVKNDKYLKHLKDHLSNLYSLVKKEESLEPLLLCCQLHEEREQQNQPLCKKVKTKRNKQEVLDTCNGTEDIPVTHQATFKPYNTTEDPQHQPSNTSRNFKQETIETLIGLPGASAAPSYSDSNNYENGQPYPVIYQEEVPHNPEAQVEGAPPIYYYQKMTSDVDMYTMTNQTECNQVSYNLTEFKDSLG